MEPTPVSSVRAQPSRRFRTCGRVIVLLRQEYHGYRNTRWGSPSCISSSEVFFVDERATLLNPRVQMTFRTAFSACSDFSPSCSTRVPFVWPESEHGRNISGTRSTVSYPPSSSGPLFGPRPRYLSGPRFNTALHYDGTLVLELRPSEHKVVERNRLRSCIKSRVVDVDDVFAQSGYDDGMKAFRSRVRQIASLNKYDTGDIILQVSTESRQGHLSERYRQTK